MTIPIIFLLSIFSSGNAYFNDEFNHIVLGEEKKHTTEHNAKGLGTSLTVAGVATYILSKAGNRLPVVKFGLAVLISMMVSNASAGKDKQKEKVENV